MNMGMLPKSVRDKVPENMPWTPEEELKQSWLSSQYAAMSLVSARPPSQNASKSLVSTCPEFSRANVDEWW